MTAAFPAAKIPVQPAPDGLGFAFPNYASRKDVDMGPARQQRVAGTVGLLVDQPFQFTNRQYEYFRAWLEYGINAGADWFTIDLFLGDRYSNVTGRFQKGGIAPKRDENGWRVETKIELKDLPTISASELDARIGAPGAGLPAWPAPLLANPLDDEFAHVLPDPLIRGEEGGALPDQARTMVVAPTVMTFNWPFAWADFETFKAFVKWRLGWGLKWLTMPVFRGATYQGMTARFVTSSLRARRDGPDWLVEGQVELRDLPPLSLAAAEAQL